jgi:hypothetical protein
MPNWMLKPVTLETEKMSDTDYLQFSYLQRDKNAIPDSLAKAVLPRPDIPLRAQCCNSNHGPVCSLLNILSNLPQ